MSILRCSLLEARNLGRALGVWPYVAVFTWPVLVKLQQPDFFFAEGVPFYWVSMESLLGTNYRLTPPSQLQLAVGRKEEIFARLVSLHEANRVRGAILVGTCNRLEVILDLSEDAERVTDQEIFGEHIAMVLHDFEERDATHYLLRVATGLESMVRGEEQILGQLREAFKVSDEHGMLSPSMRNLRNLLMSSARETRRSAGMAKCKVSVASVAARHLEPAGRRFAVVGAGETGRLAIEALINRGYSDLTIVNRTAQRAAALARHFGIQALSLSDFLRQSEADGPKPWDAVLFAIEAPRPVFFARHARGLRAVVDVSMPCVLDDSTREIEGLEVCDLDGIASLVDSETSKRQATLDAADAIVRARSATLHEKLMAAGSGHQAHLGQIMDLHLDTANEEMQALLSSKLSHLSSGDQELVRQVILRTTKRNAHLHLKDVRERALP